MKNRIQTYQMAESLGQNPLTPESLRSKLPPLLGGADFSHSLSLFQRAIVRLCDEIESNDSIGNDEKNALFDALAEHIQTTLKPQLKTPTDNVTMNAIDATIKECENYIKQSRPAKPKTIRHVVFKPAATVYIVPEVAHSGRSDEVQSDHFDDKVRRAVMFGTRVVRIDDGVEVPPHVLAKLNPVIPARAPLIPQQFRLAALAALAAVGFGGAALKLYDHFNSDDSTDPPVANLDESPLPVSNPADDQMCRVEGSPFKVHFTTPDGIPGDATHALTYDDPIQAVYTLDADGSLGIVPDNALLFSLKDASGAPIEFPNSPTVTSTWNGEKIVDLVVSDCEIPEKDKGIAGAVLNERVVTEASALGWKESLPLLQDTKLAVDTFRELATGWGENMGGWEETFAKVDAAKARGKKIQTTSEFLEFLSTMPMIGQPGRTLADRAAEDMVLITDGRIAKNVEEANSRLASAKAAAPTLLEAIKENAKKAGSYPRPAAYASISGTDSDTRTGALAPELRGNPLGNGASMAALTDYSEAALVGKAPTFADPFDVPESQFAQTSREETSEVAPANAQVSAIADWMEGSLSGLLKKARGRNKERLPAFIAQTTSDLRTLAQRFDSFTASGKEVALLDVKRKFFKRMNDEQTGLVRGDGSFFSQMYADFTGEFMTQLSVALPEVPESQGVEGIQRRVNDEIRATVTEVPEEFFRKA